MAVKTANRAASKPLKSMNPRSGETAQMGSEPAWETQPAEGSRISALSRMFVWYNYFYGKKEAKECILDWLVRTDRQEAAKTFGRVPESAVSMTIGWVCRANLRGLELQESELARVLDHVTANNTAAQSVKSTVDIASTPDVPTPTRPNIQDRLRERAQETAGEIEGMYDELIAEGAKMSASFKPLSVMRSMNIAPQMLNLIKEIWNNRLDELHQVAKGKDAQLVEGYSHLGKIQIRNLIKFAEQVIADCDSYIQLKKTDRKPRTKKPVSPEKVVKNFKYLSVFDELKLKSETATKLVEATEAWLYDTKKRKLIHVVADQHAGTFTVKGSSVVGFDSVQTMQKTLRKPAEQLKSITSAGKPGARKAFKDIKSTEIKWNGRGNENLVILRVW